MLWWFLRFSEFAEFTEFNESFAPFRENSNVSQVYTIRIILWRFHTCTGCWDGAIRTIRVFPRWLLLNSMNGDKIQKQCGSNCIVFLSYLVDPLTHWGLTAMNQGKCPLPLKSWKGFLPTGYSEVVNFGNVSVAWYQMPLITALCFCHNPLNLEKLIAGKLHCLT